MVGIATNTLWREGKDSACIDHGERDIVIKDVGLITILEIHACTYIHVYTFMGNTVINKTTAVWYTTSA